jgi:hypothetical protein
MIDESCKDLDDGFNPCRKQVAENGELCQYAHMYDVMNERYDREEDTRYLDSVKRDKITSTTPVLLAGNNTQIYANSTNGEGRVDMLPSSAFNNPDNHTEASIPSAKAVADYVTANISPLEAEIEGKVDKVSSTFVVERLYGVAPDGTQFMKNISTEARNIVSGHKDLQSAGSIADYAPIPLPVSKGGTGGNTPYVTDDLDSSAIFVMHDAPNDRYDAAPMSALRNYLTTQFMSFDNELIPEGADLNTYKEPGNYSARFTKMVHTVVNKPNDVTMAFNLYVVPMLSTSKYTAQYLVEYNGGRTYYRHYFSDEGWASWNLLYSTNSLDVSHEISNAFTTRTAVTVAHNDLLTTNGLMMDYVDGSLINYNSITVSGGTSKLVYNNVRFKNNRIYGDCDFTVDSEGGDGGVEVNIKINGTDINIPPAFTKFILSNKPMLVHKSSNTIIEGKNIYNITDGTVYIQFNIGDSNTGEFIFIVDSVFTGYNQPM